MRYLYNHRYKPIATIIGIPTDDGEVSVHINFFEGNVSFKDTTVPLNVFEDWKKARQVFEIADFEDDKKQMDIFDL